MQDQTVLSLSSTISFVMIPAGLQRASGSCDDVLEPLPEAGSDCAADIENHQPYYGFCRLAESQWQLQWLTAST